MNTTRRIVCLANSRKMNGRCIAGRELIEGKSGDWIRPVSDRPHHEVSEYERQYENGRDPTVLDVIDVPLIEPMPHGPQSENWLIDPEFYWTRVGQVSWNELAALCDDGPLWINGYSTIWGLNDQVPVSEAEKLHDSLRLIRVPSLKLRVYTPGKKFNDPKRKVQAIFKFQGDNYRLRVTDPVVERSYLAKEDGIYPVGRSYMTVSLGEPYKEHYYKLVAALITDPGYGA